MLSPLAVKLIDIMPEKLLIKTAQKIVKRYIKKNARLKVDGLDKLNEIEGPFVFISNHLSNSDGLILDYLLKEKYNPYFIAGKKLSKDPITNLGVKIVRNIQITPNSVDKEAITDMVRKSKAGENILIFPEGTRSRNGSMIEGKKGVLLLARLTKAKIIPVSLTGTEKLLPISKDGNMGNEKWHEADVTVTFGDVVNLPRKTKEQAKHDYDDECLEIMMKSIAENLPEEYRGVYK